MVMYSCPRCGYSNKIKTHIRKHFLRQVICSVTCSDIPIEECYREVLGEDFPGVSKSKYWCKSNVSNNVSICKSNVSMCKSNVSNNVSNIYKCKYCDKEYIHRQSKYTHEKTCKERDTYTKEEVAEVVADKMADKDLLINELKSQIELLLKERGNTTNYNTQNNYIVINAFGNENLKYITQNDISNLISNGPMSSIPNLLKQIHFNPEHEENHNIQIPNKKQALTKVYNGEKWIFQKKLRTIEDMTNKAYKTIINNFNENKNNNWKKIVENICDDDKDTLNKIQSDTELMILNNQDVVKEA